MTDTSAVAVTDVTPVTMPIERREGPDQLTHIIERYLRDPSVDVVKLEHMITLQERMMRWQAESTWNTALAEAQSKMHAVANDSANPQTRSRYASYAAIDGALRPIYSEHGFALSFDTEESPRPESVRVVCNVSKGGHSRRYQIDMPADGKGARGSDVMTKTHATGSAVSYGMRYLLKMIFNVATGEVDDDGNAAGRRRPPTPAPNVMKTQPHDPLTGEISPPATSQVPGEEDDEAEYDRLQQIVDRMEDAAAQGTRALKDLWLTFSSADRAKLEGAKNRLKAIAEAADQAKQG